MDEKFNWVELTNPRAEREFEFLVREVGAEKIIEARARLGSQKAYPLNLARVLKVNFPNHLQYLPAAELREKIQELRRFLLREG